jgi:hypothetical protein
MDQTKMANRFLKVSLKGRRNVGAHRLTWLKYVENDLRELKMIMGRQKANNRDEMRRLRFTDSQIVKEGLID